MTQTQSIEQLKHAQKAAMKMRDPKKARAEYDRLAEELAAAEYEAAYQATQAEAQTDEARKQADIELRQRHLAAIKTAEAETDKGRKRNAEIVEDIRQLKTKIEAQRASLRGYNSTMSGLDDKEDYGRFCTDWDNGLYQLLEFHQMPRGGHAAREEPLAPMTDALDRLASRVAYVKKQTKLPQ